MGTRLFLSSLNLAWTGWTSWFGIGKSNTFCVQRGLKRWTGDKVSKILRDNVRPRSFTSGSTVTPFHNFVFGDPPKYLVPNLSSYFS